MIAGFRSCVDDHGYRIDRGTLYPMLHRLEERGYLKAREIRQGRIKRLYYKVTAKGRKALAKPRIVELIVELIIELIGKQP